MNWAASISVLPQDAGGVVHTYVHVRMRVSVLRAFARLRGKIAKMEKSRENHGENKYTDGRHYLQSDRHQASGLYVISNESEISSDFAVVP